MLNRVAMLTEKNALVIGHSRTISHVREEKLIPEDTENCGVSLSSYSNLN